MTNYLINNNREIKLGSQATKNEVMTSVIAIKMSPPTN